MMDLPDILLQHEVTIEPYTGNDGYGRPVYDTATTVRCWVDNKRRLVRAATGDEVVSEATIYAPLETTAPPESKVTLPNGRAATVIQALHRDGGDLPVPSHLEIVTT